MIHKNRRKNRKGWPSLQMQKQLFYLQRHNATSKSFTGVGLFKISVWPRPQILRFANVKHYPIFPKICCQSRELRFYNIGEVPSTQKVGKRLVISQGPLIQAERSDLVFRDREDSGASGCFLRLIDLSGEITGTFEFNSTRLHPGSTLAKDDSR